MNYFKYILLITGLVLAGASCGLKTPTPEDSTKSDAEMEQLKDEISELKKTTKDLKDDLKEKEDQLDKMEKVNLNDEEEMMEAPSNPDDFKFDERAGGIQKIRELSLKPSEESIVILLTADLEEYEGDDAYAAFGCKDVLVPVEVELEKEMSDLAHAIVELITTKKDAYADKGLSNSVSGHGFTLENVKYEDGKRIIELSGDKVTLSGVCSDARIIYQLQETIKIYDEDFEIRLNGSAKEWTDLFELLG